MEIRNGRVSNVVGDGLEGVEMIEVSQRGDQMEWKKEERLKRKRGMKRMAGEGSDDGDLEIRVSLMSC